LTKSCWPVIGGFIPNSACEKPAKKSRFLRVVRTCEQLDARYKNEFSTRSHFITPLHVPRWRDWILVGLRQQISFQLFDPVGQPAKQSPRWFVEGGAARLWMHRVAVNHVRF